MRYSILAGLGTLMLVLESGTGQAHFQMLEPAGWLAGWLKTGWATRRSLHPAEAHPPIPVSRPTA